MCVSFFISIRLAPFFHVLNLPCLVSSMPFIFHALYANSFLSISSICAVVLSRARQLRTSLLWRVHGALDGKHAAGRVSRVSRAREQAGARTASGRGTPLSNRFALSRRPLLLCHGRGIGVFVLEMRCLYMVRSPVECIKESVESVQCNLNLKEKIDWCRLSRRANRKDAPLSNATQSTRCFV